MEWCDGNIPASHVRWNCMEEAYASKYMHVPGEQPFVYTTSLRNRRVGDWNCGLGGTVIWCSRQIFCLCSARVATAVVHLVLDLKMLDSVTYLGSCHCRSTLVTVGTWKSLCIVLVNTYLPTGNYLQYIAIRTSSKFPDYLGTLLCIHYTFKITPGLTRHHIHYTAQL